MPKQQITQNFSRSANTYDAYADVQRSAGGMLCDILPSSGVDRILEVGCGTGIFTEMLKDKYPSADLGSIDISPAMVDAASKRLDGHGVKFAVCDGEKMAPDGSFDLITSNATLHWFSDMEGAISRYSRCLRKGGAMVFSIFGPETFSELKFAVGSICGDATFASDMFMNKEGVEAIFKKYFFYTMVREERLTRRFTSLMELLRSIKYTGVSGVRAGSFFWTRETIEEAERAYISKYGSIEATYQVFLCRGTPCGCPNRATTRVAPTGML